nr:DUF4974 domain-containing protein [Cytophagales bacterium]
MNKRTLLERFLRDEQLNSKELETIISLLKDGELDDVFEEDLEDLWSTIEMDQIEWDSTTLKNRLFQKIGEKQKPQGNRTAVKTKISQHVRYAGIAASILVFLVAAVLVYTNQSTDDKSSIKQEVVEWVTKSNPVGIKTVVKLQDGSSVYLNAESSIQYPVDFIANRTIELIGEAFFEVAEGHSSPFSVRAGNLETVAMGTSFNIKNFDEFPLEVVLATGKVSVQDAQGGESLYLSPGEGVISRPNAAIQKFQADIQASKYWREGTLHLDKLDFPQLKRTLERWYGVTITVRGNAPRTGFYSGTFTNNETLTNVLEAMKFAHGFQFQLEGKKLIIDFNKNT